MTSDPTVLVLGDQLSRDHGALRDRSPSSCRVLLIENRSMLTSRRWHRQRAHLIVSAMRHFADELRDAGFAVDYRRSESFAAGLADHRRDHGDLARGGPTHSHAAVAVSNASASSSSPTSSSSRRQRNSKRAAERTSLRMEDFYRWQRRRLDILMDGADPVGGRWNFDAENREGPPRDGRSWPPLTALSSTPSTSRYLPTSTTILITSSGEPNPSDGGR